MKKMKLEDLTSVDLLEIKRRGFSDSQIARATGEAAERADLCAHI